MKRNMKKNKGMQSHKTTKNTKKKALALALARASALALVLALCLGGATRQKNIQKITKI